MSAATVGADPGGTVRTGWDGARGIARILLVGPAGNALSGGMVLALERALSWAAARTGCRVLILEGAGSHFCSGMRQEELLGSTRERRTAVIQAFAACLALLRESALPSLALVQGRVQGGGVGLVAACDLVLATAEAEFLLPEALAGLIPAVISPILARRVGAARLRYLALSTRPILAPEAQTFGLVDQVLAGGGSLQEMGERQVRRLLCSAPGALAAIKNLGQAHSEENLRVALERSAARLEDWLEAEEAGQGLRAAASGEMPPWWVARGPSEVAWA